MFLRLRTSSSIPIFSPIGCLSLFLLLVAFSPQAGVAQYYCDGRAAITMPSSSCSGSVAVCSDLMTAVTTTWNWFSTMNNTAGNSVGVAVHNYFTTAAYSQLLSITNNNTAYPTACKKIAAIVAQVLIWNNSKDGNVVLGNATYTATVRQAMLSTVIPNWGYTIGQYIACGPTCTNYTTTTSTTAHASSIHTATAASTVHTSTRSGSSIGSTRSVSSVASTPSGTTRSGSSVASTPSGTTRSGSSVASTPSGTTRSGSSVASTPSGTTRSGSGIASTPAGAGIASTPSGTTRSVSSVASTPSGTTRSGSSVASTPSGSGIASTPSGSGIGSTSAGSGIASTAAGSGIASTPAGSGIGSTSAGSGIASTPAGSGIASTPAGSGIASTPAGSGIGSTPAGSGIASTPAGSGIASTPAGSGIASTPAGSGIGSTSAGSGIASTPAGSGIASTPAGSGIASTPAGSGIASTSAGASTAGSQSPVVTTSTFSVMGTTIPINASVVPAPTNITQAEIFYGVPFAQPPVGNLRLEKPQPVLPYNVTLNCTTWQNIPYCHNMIDQAGIPASEDCLKLVIYRPAGATNSDSYPVLVWIHGGAYVSGSAYLYAPPFSYGFPNFYVSQGIIVVQIQYRLALLGFGTDGSGDFPGNYGLFDQQLALQWISENIGEFGGDKKRMTLYGESAGASSVAYQSIQPNSTHLFQQAIQMSGSFNSPWAAPTNMSVTSTAAIAAKLNCTEPSLKACLKAVNISTLVTAIASYPKLQLNFEFASFEPTYDNDFIYEDFATMIQQAEAKPTLAGFNSDESLFLDAWQALAVPGFTMPSANNFTAANLATLINGLIVPSDPNNTDAVAQINGVRQALVEFYTYGDNHCPAYFYYQQYTRFLTDIQFIIPILWEARAKSQRGWPVALYHDTYLSPNLAAQLPYPAVPHTNDLPYSMDVFYLYAWTFTANDFLVRQYWANLYVNFTKNGIAGVPVGPLGYPSNGGNCNKNWKHCSQGSQYYTALNINLEPFVENATTADSVPGRLDFWDQLSQTYDLTLVESLPNTMGECVQGT